MRGGGFVHDETDVVVPLQQGGRTGGVHFAFGNVPDRLRLVLTPGHQDDAPGREHRADTHRDGAVRGGGKVVVEKTRLPLAGAVRQADRTGARLLVASALVETHLAPFAHAHDQQVKSAGQSVEFGAIRRKPLLRNGTVRNMDVLRADINLVQQRLMQAPVAALQRIRRGRVVFVNGNHLHVLEGEFSGLAAAGKFFIKRHRGGSRGQSQPEKPALAALDGGGHEVRHGFRGRPGFRIDVRPDLLVIVQDAAREILFNQGALVGQGECFVHKMQMDMLLLQK